MPKRVVIHSAAKQVSNPPADQGIRRIAVTGFKSLLSRQEIEVRHLTILAGANSSGKSSIMQPLLLLKQTLEAPYDPGALKLDDPNVRYTAADQFLAKKDKGNAVSEFKVEMAASTIAIFSTLHQCPSGLVFESVPLVGSMRLARTSAAASECRAPLCLDVAREPAALGSIHDSDLLLASSTPIGTCLRIGAFGLFDVPCSNQCCGIGVPRSALSRRGSRTRSTGQHPR
jgi:hypothetical protein